MSLLLESIKIEQGRPCNLKYHQQRVSRSSLRLFNSDRIDLYEIFEQQNLPVNGMFKGRLIYDQKLQQFECIPYQKRPIANAVIVDAGNFSYPFKYLNRTFFDEIKRQHPGFDELILQDGSLITDSCFSNLAFFDGTRWLTPEKPLLAGTRRQKLLEEGIIHTAVIKSTDLSSFTQISFINAMLDLGESILPISRLTLK